ncbi:DUF4350 domain-containing protein [bacterium]|nr:DUF4350 domain-containing protein [bacterium]
MTGDTKKIVWAGVAFSVVLILIVFSSQAGEARRAESLASTYNAKPNGLKAFYTLLSESGYDVLRWRKSILSLDFEDPLVLIVASPREPFSESEMDSVKERIRTGSTLLVFANRHTDRLLEKFGIQAARASFESLSYLQQPTAQNVLFDTLYRPDESVSDILYSEWTNSLQPDSSGYILHYGKTNSNSVVEMPFGSGSVIAFNSAGYVANQHAGRYDNLQAVMGLLQYKTDGEKRYFSRIVFDEYHHGFKEYESVIFLLDQVPVKAGLMLVITAVLLWVYSKAKRFGRPVPVRRSSRRSSDEYVKSVSAVYLNAKAHTLALRLWHRWVMASLSARFRTNMENKLAEIMETRYDIKKEETRRTLSVVRQKLKDAESSQMSGVINKRSIPIDEDELVALSKKLDTLYRASKRRGRTD